MARAKLKLALTRYGVLPSDPESTTEKVKAKYDMQISPLLPPHIHPSFAPLKVKFKPEQIVLKKGHVRDEGRMPLPCDVILERDVQITMRDGIKVNVDIYRPTTSDTEPVPAIICWSPYGKADASKSLDVMPFGMGVPKDRISGYQKFEGVDPADWCNRGYAVVHPDARGSHLSEGILFFWGIQEAEDVHDTIEWVSQQPWNNRSVCMAGNSWLAKSQINYASRFSHPALKAIAPWESFTDMYRQTSCRGGMPWNASLQKILVMMQAGRNGIEDIYENLKAHPLYDDYWADKTDDLQNIKIPIYILGSFSSIFHTYGSFDMFRNAGPKEKWLRVHPFYEWYDLYLPENIDDLQRFFDRYCKGIRNGWEEDTPPLRLSLIGFDHSLPTIRERPETEFPLARQQLQKLYLDASNMTLTSSLPSDSTSVSHFSDKPEASSVSNARLMVHCITSNENTQIFRIHFNKYTELVGYARVRLWVSCRTRDDIDVVVQLRKIDKDGNFMKHLNFPMPGPESEVPEVNVCKYLGPQGSLRASHAGTLDPTKTSPDGQILFYKHDKQQKVPPGTIVPLDITLWPMAMIFDKGEGIALRIAGHDLGIPEMELPRGLPLPASPKPTETLHHIHTGGQHDSLLVIPVLPTAK